MLTDGPLAIFKIKNATGQIAHIGDTISGDDFELILQIKSTEEFGKISKAVLYRGVPLQKIERIEFELDLESEKEQYTHLSNHSIKTDEDCYFRLEATSTIKGQKDRCITNPIWVKGLLKGERKKVAQVSYLRKGKRAKE